MLKKLLKEFHLMEPGAGPSNEARTVKYPGVRDAIDGNTAVILVEQEGSDAAGAYPITPSTQMGEYWSEAVNNGHVNASGRPLIFVEPESEHAAAGITAGMSMTGLRSVNFTSAQGAAFMHESLYAAVGKRLPYVLHLGCRAITKATLNVHCSHDDYHCLDDTGFIQVFGRSAQEAGDLALIIRKTAELTLTPAINAMDGFLTTHLIEPVLVPEKALVAEYLGRPDDIIDTPTPAQRLLYGERRRRIPATFDVDNPMTTGGVQNQDAYMQAVAAQRPYFFDHIEALFDQNAQEFFELTGRRYARVSAYRMQDADYVIVGQGSMCIQAQAVADYLRETRKIKVGVVSILMFRPFPGDLLGALLKGRKGVAVLERTDQPLAEDLPLMRETRATMSKCMENGAYQDGDKPYPSYATCSAAEMPRLYSGCFGLGSRDFQPEAIIAAVENMLPEGQHRKFFYLGIDFLREQPANPKEEIAQQNLLDAYPRIGEMAIKGSENPNLLPNGAVAVRMHSIGGWGAVTTGKNLAITLFDLLGWDIKANPKYGSEKKGQPTTYYLSAAPEPIRINCEYTHVDVVLSPDPNVFAHTNALAGLKQGGTFIIQSNLSSPEEVWASFPVTAQKYIADQGIRVFYLDAFKVAREEASNPELQLRMQGNVFQGAFFAASPVMQNAGLTEEQLFAAIENQLQSKFGSKGKRVVEDNLRVVKRGFAEIRQLPELPVGATRRNAPIKSSGGPLMLKHMPEGDGGIADVHRFWESTGSFYQTGRGNDNLADPFIGLSVIPASTGVFRDMTQIRFEHPVWVAENCTACGNCYTACPDMAMPGLVNTVQEVFDTAISHVERSRPTRFLRKASRTAEKKLRALLETAGEQADVRTLMDAAFDATIAEAAETERDKLATEFALLREQIGDFQFSITKPYYSGKEKKAKGSGGLFSITINPYTCKGCELCVDVCDDDALKMVTQTDESTEKLRREWDFWLELPSTAPQFSRIDSLDEKIGALETLLLDKQNYGSMVGGDGACLGCGEKTAIHLFTSTVSALMQPRVEKHMAKLDDLIARLEKHIRMKVTESVDFSDTGGLMRAMQTAQGDLTLASLSANLSEGKVSQPLDPDWLRRVSQLLERLRHLKQCYGTGQQGNGRSPMGAVNSTGCTSVWASTFPYNPYPFPWTSHLFQDTPSVAMGLFEGHMVKMADGFKAVRAAELELEGKYDPAEHDLFLTHFSWRQFSDEEWLLCPPIVAIGGDGAMYDIGFQNLSRMMMSGAPIKVVVVDTQVYSNTGGQACTSGFIAQVADMSPFGKTTKGKQEIRKEISLLGLAHRTSFVLQSSISNVTHLLEGYIDGLNSRRPALLNVYAVCPPEHGVADDLAVAQSKLAVESRAYPLFRYDPDKGASYAESASLEGNPALDQDWPTYTLAYKDADGNDAKLTVPMTFADFAVTEGRFAKHFKKAPPETWNDDMVLLADFLNLGDEEREGKLPFIWGVDAKQRLIRLLVTEEVVLSCEERLNYWHQLKSLCGLDRPAVDEQAIADRARAELIEKLSASLATFGISGASGATVPAEPAAAIAGASLAHPDAAEGFEPVWVETPECTACDECMNINAKIFAYNDKKQAVVVDPRAGKFADIVKAAEKCTAGCIHPGKPWNLSEPGLEKLLVRAEKFN